MDRRYFLAAALILAFAAPSSAQSGKAGKKPAPQPAVTLTGLTVNSVERVGDQLVANATATLKVAGTTVTRDLPPIPLTLGSTPNKANAACPILNLSLGPVELELLGLVVNLDNCKGGPITVDITAVPGNLLGDLLCAVANLLNGGLDLGDILDSLNAAQLTTLTTGLTDALNQVLSQVVTAPATPGGGHSNGACDILHLKLGPIHLDLLGLVVDTSRICLDITAVEGDGNLLGNLLCALTDLLNKNGSATLIQILIANIQQVLAGL